LLAQAVISSKVMRGNQEVPVTIDPQGLSSAHLIVEYGDYECSYSSQAYR